MAGVDEAEDNYEGRLREGVAIRPENHFREDAICYLCSIFYLIYLSFSQMKIDVGLPECMNRFEYDVPISKPDSLNLTLYYA